MKEARRSPAPRLHYRIQDYQNQALRDCLERDLARMLTWQFPLLGQACHGQEGIVIRLVDEEELERHRRDKSPSEHLSGGFDALGVYVEGTSVLGRCTNAAEILVSPDKVLQAAQRLHRSAALPMPIEAVNRVLIAGVAIHELGHAMMDGQTGPLQAALDGWFDPSTSHYGFVVEESLAEAYVLAQQFNDDERHVISAFIESGPRPYQAGFYWHAQVSNSPCNLMTTMRAWRDHKALDTGLLTRVPELRRRLHSLQAVANELLRGRAPALPFEFRKAFFIDVRQALSTGLVGEAASLVQDHQTYRHDVHSGTAAPPAVGCAQAGEMQEDETIRAWLEQHGVTQYRIEGGRVHVDGDVDISDSALERIPVRFGRVNGHFDCSGNKLRSLCDLPNVVIGNVYCCHNPISSLAGLASGNRVIAGYLCLDSVDEALSNLLQAVEVNGLRLIVAPAKGVDIVNRYLGHPDDIFACQAELIENGLEDLAGNDPHCQDPHCQRCLQAAIR